MVQANVSKERQRVVQTVLAVVTFTALWATLHLFDQLVDVPRVREWLEKHEWWLFINRDIRETILTQFWQFLLALIVTVKVFSRLDSLAKVITKRYLPEFPWFLNDPKRSRPLDFLAYQLALVGRSEELAALEKFLHRENKFCWWWLNGRGGGGKSRVALEWMRSLPKSTLLVSSKGYDAGFLREPFDSDDQRIRQWKPRHPTVIVIDDVGEHAEAALALLTIFGQQESAFDYPVRVLLVERTVPAALRRLQEEKQFNDHCYSLDPLTLSPLEAPSIQQLGQELSTRHGASLALTIQDVDTIRALGGGLPLFSILALESFVQCGELRVSTSGDLVRKYVHRLRAEFRQNGLDQQYWPLMALATLTQGLPWQDAEGFLGNTKCPEKRLLDRIFDHDTVKAIPPLKPDILGEYFLLEEFGDLPEPQRQRFLSTAWDTAPISVAGVLFRSAIDFAEHPQLAALSAAPERPAAAVYWGRSRVELLGAVALPIGKVEFCLQELDWLHQKYPASAEVQVMVAEGLRNAHSTYGAHGSLVQSWVTFKRFKRFAEDTRDNVDVQILLAKTALSVFEWPHMHRLEIEDALLVQADQGQIESLRQNADIQLTVALTAAKFIEVDWHQAKAMFPALYHIAAQFPQDAKIQRVVTHAATESLNRWADELLDLDPFYGSRFSDEGLSDLAKSALIALRGIAGRKVEDDELHREVAACLAETLSRTAFYFSWPISTMIVDILEALAVRNPEKIPVQLYFAEGTVSVLRSCVHFKKQGERAVEMEALVQRLKQVIPEQFQNQSGIHARLSAAEALLVRSESN